MDLAFAADALRHLRSGARAGINGSPPLIVQIERAGPVARVQFRARREALVVTRSCLGALSADECVDHQRGTVIDEIRRLRIELGLGEAVDTPLGPDSRTCRGLA